MEEERKLFRIKPIPVIIIILLTLNLIVNSCVILILSSYKTHIINYTNFEHIVTKAIQQSVLINERMKSIESRTYTFGDHLIYNTNELSVLRKDYEKRFGIIKERRR